MYNGVKAMISAEKKHADADAAKIAKEEANGLSSILKNPHISPVLGFDEIMGKDASVDAIANEVLEGELQGQNGYTVTFAGKQAQIVREFVGTIDTNSGGTVSFGS